MIPLASRLDDIDYDDLVDIARSRLPGLAPQWTDYNVHDPGIMLVELLAWIADTQVYALARNRRDERRAMAALLGVVPRGAVPARGVVYPADVPQAQVPVAADSRILPIRARAPRVEAATAVDLLPIELVRVVLREGEAVTDVTEINRRARASFQPFGPRAAPGATLHLRLALRPEADLPLPESVLLSLGFEAGIATDVPAGLGGIDAVLNGDTPLLRVFDSSAEMQGSGAMVFRVATHALFRRDAEGRPIDAELVLRPRQPAALVPRLRRIDVNAIPVTQRATFADAALHLGTGRANQAIAIAPPALFGSDEMPDASEPGSSFPRWQRIDGAALRVATLAGEAWHDRPFADSGPADRSYAMDERGEGVAIRFGNGINGRRPAIGESIAVSLQLSCGARGNVASSLDWRIETGRMAVRNRAPFAGGADAEDVDAALARARRRLRDQRLLATSDQLRAAVAGLPPYYGIGRIDVEEGWERGRREPATSATRTLLVARAEAGSETPAWLRAVAATVRPRIALGERLVIAAPAWRDFAVRLAIEVAPSRRGAEVRAAVEAALRTRLGAGWPMGRDVDTTTVAGWVRRIDGVTRVHALTLIDAEARPIERIAIGRGTLPRLGEIAWETPR